MSEKSANYALYIQTTPGQRRIVFGDALIIDAETGQLEFIGTPDAAALAFMEAVAKLRTQYFPNMESEG